MFIKVEDLTFEAGFPITDWSKYAKEKHYIWNGEKHLLENS